MASMIRVTKEFGFEMAHVLCNYDGPCRNVHGHSYKLFVTIAGNPVDDPDNPKNGMVMDFTDMKRIIKNEIINVFDHSLVISTRFDREKLDIFSSMFGNVVVVEYQPTCENLVSDFANRLGRKLPESIVLHSIKLYETATSFAEWYSADNQKL